MTSFHGRYAFDVPSSLLSLDLANHCLNLRIVCSFCLAIRRGVEACYQVIQPFRATSGVSQGLRQLCASFASNWILRNYPPTPAISKSLKSQWRTPLIMFLEICIGMSLFYFILAFNLCTISWRTGSDLCRDSSKNHGEDLPGSTDLGHQCWLTDLTDLTHIV